MGRHSLPAAPKVRSSDCGRRTHQRFHAVREFGEVSKIEEQDSASPRTVIVDMIRQAYDILEPGADARSQLGLSTEAPIRPTAARREGPSPNFPMAAEYPRRPRARQRA